MTCNDEEYEFLLPHVERIFEGVRRHVRLAETVSTDLIVRRIRLYGEPLREFIEKYDLMARGLDMRVPGAVRTGGSHVASAYLMALFQADGTVRAHSGENDSFDVVLGFDLRSDDRGRPASSRQYGNLTLASPRAPTRGRTAVSTGSSRSATRAPGRSSPRPSASSRLTRGTNSPLRSTPPFVASRSRRHGTRPSPGWSTSVSSPSSTSRPPAATTCPAMSSCTTVSSSRCPTIW